MVDDIKNEHCLQLFHQLYQSCITPLIPCSWLPVDWTVTKVCDSLCFWLTGEKAEPKEETSPLGLLLHQEIKEEGDDIEEEDTSSEGGPSKLKTLDTIGNCQSQSSHLVYLEHMHKITIL